MNNKKDTPIKLPCIILGNLGQACEETDTTIEITIAGDLGLSGSLPVLVNSASDLSLCGSEFGLYSSDLGLSFIMGLVIVM